MVMDLIPSSHEVWIFDESGVNLPCVGNIISSYLILTVASCLYGKTQNKLSIKTKVQTWNGKNVEVEEERIRNIDRVIFHPSFKNSSLENDIAIIVLNKNLDNHFHSTTKNIPNFGVENKTSDDSISSSTKNTKIATHHLKWIQSASAKLKKSNKFKFNKQKRETDRFKPRADEDDYSVEASVPKFEKNDSQEKDYLTEEFIVGGLFSDEPISYQLSLQYQKSPPNGRWQHICGAAILDQTTAITAAHCFDDNGKEASRYRVIAGEKLLDTPENTEQVLRIEKIIIHPNYINHTTGSDIAILQVDKIRFNKYAGGIWMSRSSNAQLSDMRAVISGWGQVSNLPETSNSLVKGNVQILSPQKCLDRLKNGAKVPVREGVICTLNPFTRTCRGDSGGPLVIQNYKLGDSTGNLLVGVLSFGDPNCEVNGRVGFFTEINYFYDWIQGNRKREVKTTTQKIPQTNNNNNNNNNPVQRNNFQNRPLFPNSNFPFSPYNHFPYDPFTPFPQPSPPPRVYGRPPSIQTYTSSSGNGQHAFASASASASASAFSG